MIRHGFCVFTSITFAIAVCGGTAPAQGLDKKVIPAAARQNDMDQPLLWMAQARHNYAAVKDYSCTLVSQERVGVRCVLQDRSVIQFKLKEKPFSVHMRWIAPKKSEGQEVIF